MKGNIKKVLFEFVRIVLTAALAALGIESTGCVASGDNAAAAFSVSGK